MDLVLFLDESIRVEISQLEDIYGPCLQRDFQILLLSEEVCSSGFKINQQRQTRGMEPMQIVKIQMLQANSRSDSSHKLGSTQIREYYSLKNKQVDINGIKKAFTNILSDMLSLDTYNE